MFIHTKIHEYSNDVIICKKLSEVLNNPINKLGESINFDINNQTINCLPKSILTTIVCKLYEKIKKIEPMSIENEKYKKCLVQIRNNYVTPNINNGSYQGMPNSLKATMDQYGVYN